MTRIWFLYLIVLLLSSCGNDDSVIVDGYCNKQSLFNNEAIDVFINGKKEVADYKLVLFDVNNNKVDEVTTSIRPQEIKNETPWENGFGYDLTFSYHIPKDLKSGMYYFEGCAPFFVKNKNKTGDVLVVYPTNTVAAYNEAGGRSLYHTPLEERPNRVSFLRAIDETHKFQNYAIEFMKWLPSNQEFNVDYITDFDMDEFNNIRGYKVIVLPGHSEYWTRKARRNFDRFVDEGGHAMILSGNTMWWQVRYSEDNTKLICYKNYDNDSLVLDSTKTCIWPDKRLKYSVVNSIGADFNRGGYGLKEDSGWNGYKILRESPVFEGTNLKVGNIIHLPSAEYDGAPLVFKNNTPMLDTSEVRFYRQELLAYDIGFREGKTYGRFIIFQKTKKSGIIINTGSTNWCAQEGFNGENGNEIKKITKNMFDYLLNGKNIFTN